MSFPADSFASRVLGLRTALAIAGCLATQGCERATPTATDPDLADGSRAGAASLQPSWLGEADVRRFFVIGNSLSAGTMDGAQFTEGSRCSPPALFARQANVPDFQYPKISEPGLAFDITGFSGGKLELISLDPLIIERNPDAGKLLNGSLSRPYNNAAVPGAMAFEALDVDRTATSFFGNPGYDLLFRGYGTFLEQATKLDATFITVELGTNDALIWTGFGADETAFPPIPAPVFEARYTALIEGALDITGQVVLFTPVSGLDMPLWRTVPPLLVDPSTGTPILDVGGATVPLIGPDGPLDPGDLVSLVWAPPLLKQGIGVPIVFGGTGQPLPDIAVLSAAEQLEVRALVDANTAVVRNVAAQHGLALVEFGQLLHDLLVDGISEQGYTFSAEFIKGGAYSLDAIHPTCRFYGVVANRLIDAVNARYGATIPHVEIGKLEGIRLPG